MSYTFDRNSGGVYIIAATPFDDAGALDLESTDRLVDYYIECGVSGMTILGIMGEAAKLSGQESALFARRVLERVNGRVPVIVGVTGGGLDNMAELSRSVMKDGAAGVMVAPMPSLQTDAQQRSYFAQVCKALGPDVPICLQDYPMTTTVNFQRRNIAGDLSGSSANCHAETRRLARSDQVEPDACRNRKRRDPADFNPCGQCRPVPATRTPARCGRRNDWICLSGNACKSGRAA